MPQVRAALELEPDVVVIAGGVGDTGRPGGVAAVEAAAGKVLGALSAVPTVYVLSPMPGQSGLGLNDVYGNEARRSIGEGIRRAAAAHDRPYIDMLNPEWIGGTGVDSAPTGDGNADLYVHGDRIHLNQAGEDFIGRRIAESIDATRNCG